MKTTYVSVELDTVLNDGETAQEAAETLSQGFDLTAIVTSEHGPGGGHPLIRITGPIAAVAGYLAQHGYPLEDHLPAAQLDEARALL